MGRIKRTYTYEQLGVATVDAALAAFPMECRHELRSKLLTTHRDSASPIVQRKIFREHDYSQTVAIGLNYIGPELLKRFNEQGAGAAAVYFGVLLTRIEETIKTAHNRSCACVRCKLHDKAMQQQA